MIDFFCLKLRNFYLILILKKIKQLKLKIAYKKKGFVI